MSLELVPVTWAEARDFVERHHRHHMPPLRWKFGIGLRFGEELVGVAMVGRPVAAALDDGRTLELTRCCTTGAKNAPSKLYGAAWRAAKAMGYRRLVTYVLDDESGVSLIAAGWDLARHVRGESWDRPSRRRTDRAPTCPKRRYEKRVLP